MINLLIKFASIFPFGVAAFCIWFTYTILMTVKQHAAQGINSGGEAAFVMIFYGVGGSSSAILALICIGAGIYLLQYRRKTPKYELAYDDCGHPDWEGPGSFGEWRCAGCGVTRGGL